MMMIIHGVGQARGWNKTEKKGGADTSQLRLLSNLPGPSYEMSIVEEQCKIPMGGEMEGGSLLP